MKIIIRSTREQSLINKSRVFRVRKLPKILELQKFLKVLAKVSQKSSKTRKKT